CARGDYDWDFDVW
nr:immunoglobulin heavy chain junction region [Mus musculus]MBK4187678.1 immunoglobulin heavy chain junction region [Mus musculus]MBK4187679.1 immunoglobulin heavy chain junction region [Mus musculus]MBK4187680.1 immunoglobulin heavy chain junction region [Mus musculus]MBK4187681.1 immunoglobulin heavy chain junction region [Mus musculus]